MSTFSEANEIEFFNGCLDGLAIELFYENNDIDPGLNRFTEQGIHFPDEQTIQKSAWVASILASSPDEEHKKKALAFAILAYTKYQGEEEEELYERYLYIILTRIGNLPAVGSFIPDNQREEFDQSLISSFDSVLSFEMETYREQYDFGDGDYLSQFQSQIYQALAEGDDVAISGPTSAGKSFILQKYIEQKVGRSEGFEVIYVVPTRALISEVATNLKDRYDEVVIKTSANFTEEDDGKDIFLVATPERCLKLLREDMKEHISPDLIFFDEFQKIEEGERGVLFENVVESLHEMWPEAQTCVAGPYLDDPGEKLSEITGSEVKEVKTIFTPILQLKIFLTFERQQRGDRKLKVTILSPSENPVEFEIDEPDGLTFSQFNQNKGEFLKTALNEFGTDNQNLVYASQKNWAERWANVIAEDREERPLSDDTIALQDFLKDAIHEEYSLISCLDQGVAFHHRMVPKIARNKIEEIYREEYDLDTIVSTSTLLEGVNLPAENIFIHDPTKGQEELTEFDFKNLIGRVGRLNQKLYGSIYCIQTEDDEWSEKKMTDTGNKEIEPATDRAIKSDFDDLVEVVENENIYEEDESHLRYTGILLRNKHLREDRGEVESYLDDKELPAKKINQLQTNLNQRLQGIEIPEEILRRNPTIDPIQQNKLYKSVQENPERWIIGESRSEYSFEDFRRVTQLLNKIFHFAPDEKTGVEPADPEVSQSKLIRSIVPANQWLRGYSFRDMVDARQKNEKVPDEKTNVAIRKVLETVNDDVQFVFVKYYRILTDILEDEEVTDSEWMLTFDQMLEMGSLDFNELELMSMSVDRAVVLDLPIPPNVDDVVEYLEENRYRISDFYLDHLEEQDVL